MGCRKQGWSTRLLRHFTRRLKLPECADVRSLSRPTQCLLRLLQFYMRAESRVLRTSATTTAWIGRMCAGAWILAQRPSFWYICLGIMLLYQIGSKFLSYMTPPSLPPLDLSRDERNLATFGAIASISGKSSPAERVDTRLPSRLVSRIVSMPLETTGSVTLPTSSGGTTE